MKTVGQILCHFKGKNGKIIKVAGCSPIREGVLLIKPDTTLIISAAMFLFGKNILSLFISGEPQQTQEVLAIAFKYLSIMAAMLWVLYFLYVYRSALQGLGDTLMPMVSGMAEFVMRISAPRYLSIFAIFFSASFAEIPFWSTTRLIQSSNGA